MKDDPLLTEMHVYHTLPLPSLLVLFDLDGRDPSCPYLTCRYELQRTQSTAHVGDVGLELIEGGGDVDLDFGRVGSRRAVRRDLVERLLRHLDSWRCCVGEWLT